MPIVDAFADNTSSLTSPPESGAEITPQDSTELSHVTRALYVGGEGSLRVRMLGGAVVTLANVPAGSIMPLRVTAVLGTGTTATGIVGLW